MNDFLGLGIGFGRFIFLLICLYFVIKWAVRNGICAAYWDITGKETAIEKKYKKYREDREKEQKKIDNNKDIKKRKK